MLDFKQIHVKRQQGTILLRIGDTDTNVSTSFDPSIDGAARAAIENLLEQATHYAKLNLMREVDKILRSPSH